MDFVQGEDLIVIVIGKFKETYNDDKYPSIFSAVRDEAPENKSKILGYMKTARVEARAPGYLYDRINQDAIILKPACYTDGVYAWRSDVIYYYEKYNIELPEDFITHVLRKTK